MKQQDYRTRHKPDFGSVQLPMTPPTRSPVLSRRALREIVAEIIG